MSTRGLFKEQQELFEVPQRRQTEERETIQLAMVGPDPKHVAELMRALNRLPTISVTRVTLPLAVLAAATSTHALAVSPDDYEPMSLQRKPGLAPKFQRDWRKTKPGRR